MTEEISALFDGELEYAAAAGVVDRLLADQALADVWRNYDLIGAALRGETMANPSRAARFSARLASEPTVLCPGTIKRRSLAALPAGWAAAASVAGIAVVVWAALGMRPDHAVDLARIDSTLAPRSLAVRSSGGGGSEEYMLAHQAVSPSGALNGFSHYARTVALASADAAGRR